MSEDVYKLWLSSKITELGSRKQNDLLRQFGSAEAIFQAPIDSLQMAEGITPRILRTLTFQRDPYYIESMYKSMEAKEIRYISRDSKHFPSLLKEIPDPPIGIFYIGELPSDDIPKVAIIGSRTCTDYGRNIARLFAKPLAQRGIVIVSGMARGLDSIAHKSALEGGGKTIAVLGCGVDICYPPEFHELRKDIIRNGCVLSEYPPGVRPLASNFPARNRIISGLCKAVLVTEAGKKSGTLITVNTALEQGRDVLAVPGSILNESSAGTNRLIGEGAYPATDHTDVLFVLGEWMLADILESTPTESSHKNLANNLAPDEKLVYDSLTFEPMGFDALLVKACMQPGSLHFICTTLELKGLIKKLPGLRFIRNI